MGDKTFEIEAEMLEDGIIILRARGAMVMPNIIKFRQAIREQIQRSRNRIAIDCSGITEMDAAGYAEIISCWLTVAYAGGKLFGAPAGQFKMWDNRTAFSMFGHIFRDSLDEAIRALRLRADNGPARRKVGRKALSRHGTRGRKIG